VKKLSRLTALIILVLSGAPSASFAQINTISTVAGTGACGYSGDGGPATSAQLCNPHGVAVDQIGNIYIADTENNCIRKVTANSGVISSFAGQCGSPGGYSGDGGPATLADMNAPWNLALDTAGNLYATEFRNHTVRKIDTSGIISTVAGRGFPCNNSPSGNTCGDNFPAFSADLYDPEGLAIDSFGNLYIADHGDAAIRKISKGTGIITTLTGPPLHNQYINISPSGDAGPAQNARGNTDALACDASNNLWLTYVQAAIRKITADPLHQLTGSCFIDRVAGSYSSSGSSGDGGPAISAQLNHPFGITVDQPGNVYISDTQNWKIRRIDTSLKITTFAGNGTFGHSGDGHPATAAQLSDTWQLATDVCGNLYIAESSASVIRKVSNGDAPSFKRGITSKTPICAGDYVSATGQYSATVPPDSYSWQLQSSNAAGTPDGFYDSGILTFNGSPSPSVAFTFPNSNALPCNRNYVITFTLAKKCPVTTSQSATKVIYITCPPMPIITGNTSVCAGGSTQLCVNYPDNAQYLDQWTYYSGGKIVDAQAQCITVSPTTSTTYGVTVKDNTTGCTGHALITVTPATPEFTYQVQYQSPRTYFTVGAKPTVPYSNTVPGFGHLWTIEELDVYGYPIPGTNTGTGTPNNPPCWWPYPSIITFDGFDGTKATVQVKNVTCPNPSPGQFANGHIYRIRHGIWNNSGCQWAETSHTVTVTGH
jgi:streptogramin lyase